MDHVEPELPWVDDAPDQKAGEAGADVTLDRGIDGLDSGLGNSLGNGSGNEFVNDPVSGRVNPEAETEAETETETEAETEAETENSPVLQQDKQTGSSDNEINLSDLPQDVIVDSEPPAGEQPDPAETLLLEEIDGLTAHSPATEPVLRWVVASFLLLVVSVMQFLWFNIEHFAASATHRDRTVAFCRYAGCRLPDYRAPDLLRTDDLVIRSHPDVQDALIVDAIIRNDGDFPQRFPGVHLRFFDKLGSPVAERTFASSDYLGGEMRGLQYIPPRTEVRFELEINDPGPEAIGYDLDVVPGYASHRWQ
jgi:hypothetical protein